VASTRTPKALCFRGRPLPNCRSFLLTEFDLALTEGSVRWEIGAMHNIGSRSAVGGSLLLRGAENDSSAFGAKIRFRHWLSRVVALDVSSGILVAGRGTAPGFAGHVGLEGDAFATALLDHRRGLLGGWELTIDSHNFGAFLGKSQHRGTPVAHPFAWALTGADDNGGFSF